MSRRPVTITICPSGASAGDVHQSCIVFMFLKKSAGMVLARGTAYKPGYVGGMLSASRSFAGPSVIYLSSLPPGIGRAARWSRSSLPVYLTLQPARCAACHIAVASGGLLPRLFTLAVGLRWAAWAVVFCHITLPLPTAPRRECGALCCPDFPLAPHSCASDEPAVPAQALVPALWFFIRNRG